MYTHIDIYTYIYIYRYLDIYICICISGAASSYSSATFLFIHSQTSVNVDVCRFTQVDLHSQTYVCEFTQDSHTSVYFDSHRHLSYVAVTLSCVIPHPQTSVNVDVCGFTQVNSHSQTSVCESTQDSHTSVYVDSYRYPSPVAVSHKQTVCVCVYECPVSNV